MARTAGGGGGRGAPRCGEAVYRSAPYRHELRRADCGPGITNITEKKEKIGEEGGARGGWRAAPHAPGAAKI